MFLSNKLRLRQKFHKYKVSNNKPIRTRLKFIIISHSI